MQLRRLGMADPVKIKEINHGIRYRLDNTLNGDVSGISTADLKSCMLRCENSINRAKTSQIQAPKSLYDDLYKRCLEELNRR